jgi:superfamily I DNA/RNA helicase
VISSAAKALTAGFTTDQAAAVESKSHTLIYACPGAGKTRVLIARAARLIADEPEGSILLTTFSRAAAGEMKTRLTALAGPNAKRVRIGTCHALAARHLKAHRGALGGLLAPGEERGYYGRAAVESGLDIDGESAGALIEAAKTDPAFRAEGTDEIHRLVAAYTALLKANALSDFMDMTRELVAGIKAGSLPPIPADHILVDEFQDTDPMQYAWLLLQRDAGATVTAVADDDQSIYAWRSAMGFQGMRRFERDFQAKRIVLAVNFRSRPTIVKSAAALIAHNEGLRQDKRIVAFRKGASELKHLAFQSAAEEAEYVIETLRQAGVPETAAGAVIARLNRSLHLIEATCCERRIAYQRIGGAGLFFDEPISHLMSLLAAADNPKSKRGIEHMLAWLGCSGPALAAARGASMRELALTVNSEAMPPADRQRFRELLTRYRAWREMAKRARHGGSDQALELLVLSVTGFLEERAKQQHLAGAVRLLGRAARLLIGSKGTLAQRLDWARRAGRDQKNGDGVILTTMHGSKGLEFEHVAIIDAAEGIVPHEKAAAIAEERRLFYVAMTRAQDRLLITRQVDGVPSRFLTEAGIALPDPTSHPPSLEIS